MGYVRLLGTGQLLKPWNQMEHSQPHFLSHLDFCLVLFCWFCFDHKQLPKTELHRERELLKGT